MKKRRIGIDARLLYQTGVGVYLRNLLFNLSKVNDSSVEYIVFAKQSEWSRFVDEYSLQPAPYTLKPCDISWHSFSEQIIFLFQLYSARLDIMHFPYFSWPVFYYKPFVATVHDTILLNHATGRASTLPLWLYKIKQFVFRIVFSEQVRRAKKIFVPSNAVKSELVGFYPNAHEKVLVTHEGVDEVFASSVAQKPQKIALQEKSYFLYVGNCYPHKNVEILLEAFQKLKTTNQNAKLILVGPSSIFADNLEKEYVGLGEDVLWLHDVKTAELKWLYTNAKALVFPSKAEGFGLPIVEAMSASCPLILSDIPVFHEVAADNAIYFGTSDVEGLVNELSKVGRSVPASRTEMQFYHLAKKTFETYANI